MPQGNPGLVVPASKAVSVTPSDSTALEKTRGLWVGGAGSVVVTMATSGNNVTFAGIAAGTLLPIAVTKVLLTGTTATLILALR